jgi:Tol biopolymer transport system component
LVVGYVRPWGKGGVVRALFRAVLIGVCLASLVLVPNTQAAFPGANGKIAFDVYDGSDSEIYTINPDGTGEAQLTNNTPNDSGPSWSADGKKILFSSYRTGTDAIWVMNADGSGQTQVTSPSVGDDSDPGWSPDGQSITFARTFPDGFGGNTNTCRSQLYVANANGSGATDISPSLSTNCSYSPEWSPDGALIAFVSTISTPSGNLDEDVWTIKPDGTGATQLSHHPFGSCSDPLYIFGPSWTPDGKAMTFYAGDCNGGGPVGSFLVSINRDGSGQQTVGEPTSQEPAWSPDGRRIAYIKGGPLRVANSDFTNPVTIRSTYSGSPDWQPIPYAGYPRPKGATPMQVFLVPAYKPCTAANRTHGSPLSFPSCAPPQQTSDYLTVGTPDANGQGAKSVAEVIYKVKASPAADVLITTLITDVRNKSDLSDYTGEVRVNGIGAELRITDRFNGGSSNEPGTVVDIPAMPTTVACDPTADTMVGSSCNTVTSMNAIIPGAVVGGKRAIWQFDQITVEDGGADGNVATTDNTIFLKQGVFVP